MDSLPSQANHRLLEKYREAWQTGMKPRVEQFLLEHHVDHPELVLDLIYAEFRLRQELAELPGSDEYYRRFPQLTDELRALFLVHDQAATLFSTVPTTQHEEGNPARPGAIGARINKRFDVREHLGQGTFADVWRAWDHVLLREVALKVPIRRGVPTLLQEARSAARLFHPNIVPVYEVSCDAEAPFIVTAFLPGGNLRTWLKDRPPNVPQAVTLCIAIARGLQHAHEAGILHRDLKPANILLDRAGNPYIADFGLARDVADSEESKLVGTPAYMAPEQAVTKGRRIDQRADIYALGVILYEMLTGHRPSEGSAESVLSSLRDHRPAPPLHSAAPGVPVDLALICQKALAVDPEERYASAHEVATDLERFNKGLPVTAHPLSPARWVSHMLLRTVRRNRPAVAFLSVMAVAIAAVSYILLRPTDPAAPRTVRLTTNPPGARVVFVPRSRGDGRPLPRKAIRAAGRSPLEVSLPPGDYVVVAALSNSRFHEVYRHVPAASEWWTPRHAHTRYRLDGSTVELPTIKIVEVDVSSMVPVVTDAGAVLSDALPLKAQDYVQAVASNASSDAKGYALLSYHEAVAHAEKLGKRLPTESEWLHLAKVAEVDEEGFEWTGNWTETVGGDDGITPKSHELRYVVRSGQGAGRTNLRPNMTARVRSVRSAAAPFGF